MTATLTDAGKLRLLLQEPRIACEFPVKAETTCGQTASWLLVCLHCRGDQPLCTAHRHVVLEDVRRATVVRCADCNEMRPFWRWRDLFRLLPIDGGGIP